MRQTLILYARWIRCLMLLISVCAAAAQAQSVNWQVGDTAYVVAVAAYAYVKPEASARLDARFAIGKALKVDAVRGDWVSVGKPRGWMRAEALWRDPPTAPALQQRLLALDANDLGQRRVWAERLVALEPLVLAHHQQLLAILQAQGDQAALALAQEQAKSMAQALAPWLATGAQPVPQPAAQANAFMLYQDFDRLNAVGKLKNGQLCAVPDLSFYGDADEQGPNLQRIENHFSSVYRMGLPWQAYAQGRWAGELRVFGMETWRAGDDGAAFRVHRRGFELDNKRGASAAVPGQSNVWLLSASPLTSQAGLRARQPTRQERKHFVQLARSAVLAFENKRQRELEEEFFSPRQRAQFKAWLRTLKVSAADIRVAHLDRNGSEQLYGAVNFRVSGAPSNTDNAWAVVQILPLPSKVRNKPYFQKVDGGFGDSIYDSHIAMQVDLNGDGVDEILLSWGAWENSGLQWLQRQAKGWTVIDVQAHDGSTVCKK